MPINIPREALEEFCGEVRRRFFLNYAINSNEQISYDKADLVADLTRLLETHDQISGAVPGLILEAEREVNDPAYPDVKAVRVYRVAHTSPQFEAGDRVRVITALANPFWHWTGEIEELRMLDGQPYYRVKTNGLLLLFHETWLSKIV